MSGKTSYEVNIWDTRPVQKYGTGAIVDVAAVDPMPHAGGKWNVYEITAKGNTFTVVLNGQKTVDGAQGRQVRLRPHRAPARHGRRPTTKASSNSAKWKSSPLVSRLM